MEDWKVILMRFKYKKGDIVDCKLNFGSYRFRVCSVGKTFVGTIYYEVFDVNTGRRYTIKKDNLELNGKLLT